MGLNRAVIEDKWIVRGHQQTEPKDDAYALFPCAASRTYLSSNKRNRENRISVCIPCFNEEGKDLKRTIDSLHGQKLPEGFVLDILVVLDGIGKTSDSMKEYLGDMFDLEDLSANCELWEFLGHPETIIVEPGIKNNLRVSLVVKKHNHKKVNSQMWWLAGHAKATGCEFCFATDCGIIFDRKTLYRLLERLHDEPSLAAVTGFQRVMTCKEQDGISFEFFRRPMSWLLRWVQTYEMEIDQSVIKKAFDTVGFLPVIPGPCGLYRYRELGSINHGVMNEYFSIIKDPCPSVLLGNVKLAEDRIPSCLLVFRNESGFVQEDEKSLGSKTKSTLGPLIGNPRTGFVSDAVFYYEAEKPLSQFVKQRRRWLNGSFAAFLWVHGQEWIWRGNQGVFIKCVTAVFVFVYVIQGFFIRFFGPAYLATTLYSAVFGLPVLLRGDTETLIAQMNFSPEEEQENAREIAITLTTGYLILYAVFMFAHVPNAVPVAGKDSVHWKLDTASSYRRTLFGLSMIMNAVLAFLLSATGVIIFLRVGWFDTPILIRILVAVMVFPFVVVLIGGLINGRKPSLTSFARLVQATPAFLLTSVWLFIWLPSYAFARFSDLTWGNRDTGASFQTYEVTMMQARTARNLAVAVVVSNVGTTIAAIYSMRYRETIWAMTLVILGIMGLFLPFVLVDMIYRIIKKIVYILCCFSCEWNPAAVDSNKSQEYDDETGSEKTDSEMSSNPQDTDVNQRNTKLKTKAKTTPSQANMTLSSGKSDEEDIDPLPPPPRKLTPSRSRKLSVEENSDRGRGFEIAMAATSEDKPDDQSMPDDDVSSYLDEMEDKLTFFPTKNSIRNEELSFADDSTVSDISIFDRYAVHTKSFDRFPSKR